MGGGASRSAEPEASVVCPYQPELDSICNSAAWQSTTGASSSRSPLLQVCGLEYSEKGIEHLSHLELLKWEGNAPPPTPLTLVKLLVVTGVFS